MKNLGYVPGTSLGEYLLPSTLESFAMQRKLGNIKDYIVIPFAEKTGEDKDKGLYEIFVKGRK